LKINVADNNGSLLQALVLVTGCSTVEYLLPVDVQSIAVSVYVHVSVYSHISEIARTKFTEFSLCVLSRAMAQSSGHSSGIHYVLPDLHMTLCFPMMGPAVMCMHDWWEDGVTGLCHVCLSAAGVWRDSLARRASHLAGCVT